MSLGVLGGLVGSGLARFEGLMSVCRAPESEAQGSVCCRCDAEEGPQRVRPWAAPRPSRCRPCPAMRTDAGARPTATETSSQVHSLTRLLAHSLTHSLAHSLTRSCTHSLTRAHTYTQSHADTHTLSHTQTRIHSVTRRHTYTHSASLGRVWGSDSAKALMLNTAEREPKNATEGARQRRAV